MKANVGASFLINLFISLAIYRDRKNITPRVIQDDSVTASNPMYVQSTARTAEFFVVGILSVFLVGFVIPVAIKSLGVNK